MKKSTVWKCVICFEEAQCFCIDVTLCEKHTKEYKFGYGKSLKEMREEEDEKS